jgi:hypothetical protein
MKRTSADADERLESKFKSPLAHRETPAQQGFLASVSRFRRVELSALGAAAE